jgi:tetratricopeptide (TPR) repeat protein
VLPPGHPYVANAVEALGMIQVDRGAFVEGKALLERSLQIREKALGNNHPKVSESLNNIASLYMKQREYARAEPFLDRALALMEATLGPDHPNVGTVLANLAVLQQFLDAPAKADQYWQRSLANLAKRFQQYFTYMNESERLLFLKTAAARFSDFYSFCYAYREKMPVLAARMYDVALWQKSMIVQSVASLRARIVARGDADSAELLARLAAQRGQIARLLSSEAGEAPSARQTIAELERTAGELERELVKRSALLSDQNRLASSTWNDVRRALAEGEAAVELVRFRARKEETATTRYMALVVTPETVTAPTTVVMGEARVLEGDALRQYQHRVADQGRGAPPEQAAAQSPFWKPLEPVLKRSRRIYLSPDGILNLIAWDVLAGEDGRSLIEDREIRLVSSTRDLLGARRGAETRSAVLVGNPDFGLDESRHAALARSLRAAGHPASAGRNLRSSSRLSTDLHPLPGTKDELRSIQSKLQRAGWRVEVFSDARALEEAVKGVRSPGVLHIATHSFFLEDLAQPSAETDDAAAASNEDPMLRSGLYFTGANRVLSGRNASVELDDGLLTAYEASGLNLNGTNLVVLSACETGLGKVENGEGVFGLRRAFQVAGAESVMMSLWAVPDKETQELMTLFYDRWLAGATKADALRRAKLELRSRVRKRYGRDLPFYWGSFVLVDQSGIAKP